ncbi:MAG: glycosyltransferase family 4 protein [Anaerolineae bacterium]|nr:glycosyltransferase family 4 protein [Anaerolineae bacterium]
MRLYQIGFIIEQALGHVTYGQNLQASVSQDPAIKAHWGFPAWATTGISSNIPLYRSNWTVRAGLRTRRLLSDLNRQAQLDALFFHTQVPAVLAPDWLQRIPSVVSLDATPLQYDSLGEHYRHTSGPGWLEKGKWRLNRTCFQKARRLVTWSEWAKQGLIDGYEILPEKITVIPPGVDTRAWASTGQRQQADNPVKILFVGGDFERKGGPLLLEAFQALRQLHKIDIELHIVSPQPLPHQPGVFSYTNLQPNSARLKELFSTSHIFCLPSLGDCLPLVLLEAGAAGLPVVSTRLAAIPEVVLDGKTGYVTPINDVQAVVQALGRLITDPQLRLQQGTQAAEFIGHHFDARCNTRRLLDLLKLTVDETTTSARR